MREKRTHFFGFPPCDRRAAQLWLEERYAQGWVLERLSRFFYTYRAHFRPRGPEDDCTFCVDLKTSLLTGLDREREYEALCADAGWELVGTAGRLNVYRSRPGAHPAPIQTDDSLDARRFWREHLLPSLVGAAASALLLWLLVLVLSQSGGAPAPLYRQLGMNVSLLIALLLVPILGMYLALFLADVVHWVRLRRKGPPPAQWAGRLRGWLNTAAGLLLLAALLLRPVGNAVSDLVLNHPLTPADAVVTAGDLGVEGQPSGYVFPSLLYTRTLMTLLPLRAEVYDCRFGWVADLVEQGLGEETWAEPTVLRVGDTVAALYDLPAGREEALCAIIAANLAGR